MTEPYLIFHKVRGEPTFDVAIRLDQSSVNSDEEWWIIPASGHRAYPCWTRKLDDLYSPPDEGTLSVRELVGTDEVPADLRDHYVASEPPRPRAVRPLPEPKASLDDFL